MAGSKIQGVASRHLPALLLASTLMLPAGGCRPARKPLSAPPPAVTETPAPPPAPKEKPRLTGEAAGPVKLGMPAEQVREISGLEVTAVDLQLEGTPSPALQLRRGGSLQAVAELEEGKVWRVTVVSPDYRTPEGVGVGTNAGKLERLYGTPKLMTGEGNVCAVFPKAPGLSFCFAPGTGPQVRSWKDVVQRHLGVASILVVGPED